MLSISYMLLTRVRRYLFTYHTWKILLNHIFEDLRRTKAPNTNLLETGFVVSPLPLLEDLAKAFDDERYFLVVELGGIDGEPT
jgi:hypothetical protein